MLLPIPGVAAVAGCFQTGVDNPPFLRVALMSPRMLLAYVNYSLVFVHSMVSGWQCVAIIFAYDFLKIPLWPQWSEQCLLYLEGGLTLREDRGS